MKTRLISLTVALAMAGGVAQVAGAATATDLVCTGCVDATDLANGAVTLGKLGASSVDTSKIKNGSVGLADLAPNSVDGSKIKNGSITETDLNAAVLARLAEMEADIAALKGGPYSNATFKGTYRCKNLNGGIDANTNLAAAEFIQNTSLIVADGNGTMTGSYAEHAIRRGWSVSGTKLVTTRASWEEDDTFTNTYNVSADGELTIVGEPAGPGPGGGTYWVGLIASNGDVVVSHWGNDETKPDGLSQSDRDLSVCVRTSR